MMRGWENKQTKKRQGRQCHGHCQAWTAVYIQHTAVHIDCLIKQRWPNVLTRSSAESPAGSANCGTMWLVCFQWKCFFKKWFYWRSCQIKVLYVIAFAALRLHFSLGLLKSWPAKMLEILKSWYPVLHLDFCFELQRSEEYSDTTKFRPLFRLNRQYSSNYVSLKTKKRLLRCPWLRMTWSSEQMRQ